MRSNILCFCLCDWFERLNFGICEQGVEAVCCPATSTALTTSVRRSACHSPTFDSSASCWRHAHVQASRSARACATWPLAPKTTRQRCSTCDWPATWTWSLFFGCEGTGMWMDGLDVWMDWQIYVIRCVDEWMCGWGIMHIYPDSDHFFGCCVSLSWWVE